MASLVPFIVDEKYHIDISPIINFYYFIPSVIRYIFWLYCLVRMIVYLYRLLVRSSKNDV